MLVAGTCIGGGMLALPVATGEAGFFPSTLMMLLGWAFMTTTALFLAEVNLWMEEDVHMITMASRLLGPLGKVTAWILYLFISFASLVAYTAGGGELFHTGLQKIFGLALSPTTATVLFALIFGGIVYLGNLVVGRINAFLVIGLVISYALLVGSGMPHVKWTLLTRMSWGNTIVAVPLLLTIFSFQTIVPSLTIYLKQDGPLLRRAILLGTTLALIVYLLWQLLVLGTVLVDGDQGLAAALADGKPATTFLGVATGKWWLGAFADFFAFFAIITSFLGIALGLFDFLADGLRIAKKGIGNVALGLLVAGPTLFFALTYERIFLRALDTTGGIGDSILNGIIPIMMVWVGRYWKGYASQYRIPGGKPVLVLAFAYALFVLGIELLGIFGIIVPLGS